MSKHFHRDQSSCWWGKCTGNEFDKNKHAVDIFNQILDSAVWINVHWLPRDVFVIEVCQHQGYGMRWTSDGAYFRGFLEPMMVDGHDVGWRH